MLTKVNNRSSHGLLSKQPQQVQSSKLVVVSLSCAELGTAQPQLVNPFCLHYWFYDCFDCKYQQYSKAHNATHKIVLIASHFKELQGGGRLFPLKMYKINQTLTFKLYLKEFLNNYPFLCKLVKLLIMHFIYFFKI